MKIQNAIPCRRFAKVSFKNNRSLVGAVIFMVRKDHYDQIDNSNNQYAKLKILFPTHDFDFVFTPLQIS